MQGIILSANRGDTTESHRIVRLARAYAVAISACAEPEREEMAQSLCRLHDHKGELTVMWFDAADHKRWGRHVNAAWYAESECYATHVSQEDQCVVGDMGGTVDDETWRQWQRPAILVLPTQGSA